MKAGGTLCCCPGFSCLAESLLCLCVSSLAHSLETRNTCDRVLNMQAAQRRFYKTNTLNKSRPAGKMARKISKNKQRNKHNTEHTHNTRNKQNTHNTESTYNAPNTHNKRNTQHTQGYACNHSYVSDWITPIYDNSLHQAELPSRLTDDCKVREVTREWAEPTQAPRFLAGPSM